jgi:hypothetical protein
MKLQKLPNGIWIDYSSVRCIQAYSNWRLESFKEITPPAAVCIHTDKQEIILKFSSLTDAEKFADELANAVNKIRYS